MERLRDSSCSAISGQWRVLCEAERNILCLEKALPPLGMGLPQLILMLVLRKEISEVL